MKDRTFWILILILVAIGAGVYALSFDEKVLETLSGMEDSNVILIMSWITDIATLYLGVLAIVVIVFLVTLKQTEKREAFWDLIVALALNFIIMLILKTAVSRPRPGEISTNGPSSSFPSAHASRSFVMFGILSNFYQKFLYFFYILAIIISFSRLYLGVHYFTDVWFGAIIGLVISRIVIKNKLGARFRRRFRKHVLRSRKV